MNWTKRKKTREIPKVMIKKKQRIRNIQSPSNRGRLGPFRVSQMPPCEVHIHTSFNVVLYDTSNLYISFIVYHCHNYIDTWTKVAVLRYFLLAIDTTNVTKWGAGEAPGGGFKCCQEPVIPDEALLGMNLAVTNWPMATVLSKFIYLL